ncbi:hypothetical protein FU659_18425 [Paenibacillus sp. N3.4]|nr:hypothetical protein FU659_18425 [Paenibacillus sp. N3.4]
MVKITMTQKKWLLFIHLFFSSIMLGGALTFLILSINAGVAKDANQLQMCYAAMHILAKTSVRVSTIGATVSGVLLSLLTHWGMFKYYWIIVKQLLTLLSIYLGIIGMYNWTLKAFEVTSAEGLNALHNSVYMVNDQQLWVGIILQIISVVSMFILSVFKPWGKRKTSIITRRWEPDQG